MEIQGYPNYRIYDDGRVWSKVSNRFLKHTLLTNGYFVTGMKNDCPRKLMYIHRLLAIHYIPNPENKPTVDHIDRNRTNNRLSNLRWATSCEQNQNLGMRRSNRSGHLYINGFLGAWRFSKWRQGTKPIQSRIFKSKIDCICYKYISLLKIKAGI